MNNLTEAQKRFMEVADSEDLLAEFLNLRIWGTKKEELELCKAIRNRIVAGLSELRAQGK